MTDTTREYFTTAAFVGQPNVGKSTLLNTLVGVKIAPITRKPQTTRRIIRGIKTIGHCQQVYFDTPGAVSKESRLHSFMHGQIFAAVANVDQIVAIVDATSPTSKQIDFLKHLVKRAGKGEQPVHLLINKVDLLQDKAKLLELIAFYHQQTQIKEIIPISALMNDGLDRLFEVLKLHAKPGPHMFSQEDFTDASEREIVAELIREKAMVLLKEELPYRIAVTIDAFDESKREQQAKPLVEIEGIIHVERDSQKAIVIGKGASTIKRIGTEARKDIELLLGCQVMLKLLVRVEPEWTNSPRSLRKFGY